MKWHWRVKGNYVGVGSVDVSELREWGPRMMQITRLRGYWPYFKIAVRFVYTVNFSFCTYNITERSRTILDLIPTFWYFLSSFIFLTESYVRELSLD